MSKKGKPPQLKLKINKNATPVTENKISISLQHLSKNKLRNFDFFSKKDLRTKTQALEQFLEFLQRLTSKTRLEISSLAKDNDCGFEEIPFAQINCKPDKITLGKDTKICIFRFGNNNANGNYRLMGVFNNKDPIFNIIGFDFDYSAYKH